MDLSDLQKKVLKAYVQIGYGMAVIGFAYPILVYIAGRVDHQPLLGSISDYYWAGNLTARTWFVGGLFALAALLYLFKGFSQREDVALNLAALFALGVAVFPPCQASCGWITPHGVCAVSLFACLVFVVWFCAGDTLKFLPDAKQASNYKAIYKALGLVMAATPVAATILNVALGGNHSYIFFIECAGIWAFALFWWVKTSELRSSEAVKKAIEGHMAMAVPAAPVT
jgi:hypothetical protein